MQSLRELQQGFAEEVFGEGRTGLTFYVDEAGMAPDRRLNIYRNMTYSTLLDALAAVFPVVRRLTGADFFNQSCRHFVRSVPSISGDIRDYGGEFPGYLASCEAAASLCYLPDLARLEWCRHLAFNAPDAPPLELDNLKKLDPARYSELKIRFQPFTQLMSSPYPLLHIWEVNQPEYQGDQTVDLAEGGVDLLVFRHQRNVGFKLLTAGEYGFLKLLDAETNLGAACESALLNDEAFDLDATLQWHFRNGTLAAFVLDTPPAPALGKF